MIDKENFPKEFENPRLTEHLHDRIKVEVAWGEFTKKFDPAVVVPLPQDVIKHMIIPSFTLDLQVRETNKDIFGFDPSFSLYQDELERDIPDRNDRRVVHESIANPFSFSNLDLELMHFSIPTLKTHAKNLQAAEASEIRTKLINTFLNPDSEQRLQIENDFSRELNDYAIKEEGLGKYFHNSATFYRDVVDQRFLADKRMSLHRHTAAYATHVLFQGNLQRSEWRVGLSCILPKMYGGIILWSGVMFDNLHDDPIQAYVVPRDILNELSKQGEMIKGPGQSISRSAPALEPFKKDGSYGIRFSWSIGDLENRYKIISF